VNRATTPRGAAEAYKKYYDANGGGIMMTTNGAPWGGQGGEQRIAQFPDNAIVNIDDLSAAISVTNTASGVSLPKNATIGQIAEYLRQVPFIANDAQSNPLFNNGKLPVFFKCDGCGSYQDRDKNAIDDTSGQGIKPENTIKKSIGEFHQ
jgi:hypothetical protein